MEVDAIQPWADWLGTVCVFTIGLGLIASGISLLLRFRRAVGDERRQLLWLVIAVAPLPLYVVVAFVSSHNGAGLVTVIATGGFITLVPIAAGLSVLRYRLYDVERIVAATVTWVLLTTIVVATYAFTVWLGARAVAHGPVSPALAATIGALAAAGLAFPLRRALQDQVDRRFNRRAYDARRVIGAALAAEDAGIDVEAVLREASARPDADRGLPGRTAAGSAARRPATAPTWTWTGTAGSWPGSASTRTATTPPPSAGPPGWPRPSSTTPGSVPSWSSRSRRSPRPAPGWPAPSAGNGAGSSGTCTTAPSSRCSRWPSSSSPPSSTATRSGCARPWPRARTSAQAAVRELRDLANGLHPAALADGGLAAALDDMARHSPVPLRVQVDRATGSTRAPSSPRGR